MTLLQRSLRVSLCWVGGKSRLFSKCMLLLYDPAVGWALYSLYGCNKREKLRLCADFDKTKRHKYRPFFFFFLGGGSGKHQTEAYPRSHLQTVQTALRHGTAAQDRPELSEEGDSHVDRVHIPPETTVSVQSIIVSTHTVEFKWQSPLSMGL